MEHRKHNGIGLSLMVGALSLLLLWAAECTGWFALLFLLPLSVLNDPLVREKRWVGLCVATLLTALFVFFLPVRHYVWLLYLSVLAPFAPLRTFFAQHIKSRVGASAACVLACFASLLLAVLLLRLCTGAYALYGVGFFGHVLAILGAAFLFFAEDVAYHLFARLYERRLRKALGCA